MTINNIILNIFISSISFFPQMSQASLFGDSEVLTGTKYTDPDLPVLPDPSFASMAPDAAFECWIEEQLTFLKSEPVPAVPRDLPAVKSISTDQFDDFEDWLLEVWVLCVLDPITSRPASSLSIEESNDSTISQERSFSSKKRKRSDKKGLIASEQETIYKLSQEKWCPEDILKAVNKKHRNGTKLQAIINALEKIKNNQLEADQPQHKKQRVQ